MTMKRSWPIYVFIGVIILLSWLFRSSKDKPEPFPDTNDRYSSKLLPSTKAIKPPLSIDFAGEEVPLELFDVIERLDRELLVNTYWHSNSLQLFKLAARWFPTIEKILKEEGLPDDFKYMALAESGLRNVISSRDAVGMWQFLKSTGREYGLEISRTVDERYHIEKSTRAACKYLKESHEDLGDWTLAAASYNIGKPRLKRLLKNQGVNSYYDLYLNEETERYIFRIVALKAIFSDPEKYGFDLNEEDLYEPIQYCTEIIDHPIKDLAKFATDNGTNYKTLKLLNPWLRDTRLNNSSRKIYNIKLPS